MTAPSHSIFPPILALRYFLDVHSGKATSVPPLVFSSAAIAFGLHIVWSDLSNIIYYSARVFLHSILSIFFRNIDVVGTENIPQKGPVIFTGNHSNQFVDAMQVLCHGRHKVGFLIAEKSYRHPVVGSLSRLFGCIPVKRPQDSKRKGTGRLILTRKSRSEGNGNKQMYEADKSDKSNATIGDGGTNLSPLQPSVPEFDGRDTLFTREIAPGDQIRPVGAPRGYKVVSIESDEKLILAEVPNLSEFIELRSNSPSGVSKLRKSNDCTRSKEKELHSPSIHGAVENECRIDSQNADGGELSLEYHVLERVNQGSMFDRVIAALSSGQCLGIFPEGGSTDLSWFQPGELLTLKPGIAIIAMEAMEKHKLSVPIVPVGLSYYDGDKFRGRVRTLLFMLVYLQSNNFKESKFLL